MCRETLLLEMTGLGKLGTPWDLMQAENFMGQRQWSWRWAPAGQGAGARCSAGARRGGRRAEMGDRVGGPRVPAGATAATGRRQESDGKAGDYR